MRTVALVLLCLAGLALGEEVELETEDFSDALSNLLFAARAPAAPKVAPKRLFSPKKAAPAAKPVKKVAPKRAAPAAKPVKKVAPKRGVPAAKPVKKVAPKRSAVARKAPTTGSGLRSGRKTYGANRVSDKKLLFDVRELGGLTDENANLLGFANVDPYDLGYFDPSGFTIGASENKIRSYREAELKHGRIAMLAALGFVVGEKYHPLFDGEIDGASIYALQKSIELAPQIWILPVIALILSEACSAVATFRLSKDPLKTFELTDEYTPGDVLSPLGITFDPLGLKPKDPEAFKEMQTKELNNGRVAMIASILFFFQECYTGKPIF
jgi:light-harvesting complex I chlorophyll a/b binding protein 1